MQGRGRCTEIRYNRDKTNQAKNISKLDLLGSDFSNNGNAKTLTQFRRERKSQQHLIFDQ